MPKGSFGIAENFIKSIKLYYTMSISVISYKNILKISLEYVIIKRINVSETTGVIYIVETNGMHR